MSVQITTADYVLWAYRLLLEREPENSEAVNSWQDTSPAQIVDCFLRAPEFVIRHSLPAWMREGRDFWFISVLADGTRFWVRADDEYISRHVIRGNYEPVETAFVRRHVKKGMNVLDIGANIGWFTINMAALVGPEGHVDAFEPREDLARYLQRTVAENKLGNVAIYRCALAAVDGYGMIANEKDDRNHGGTHLVLGNTCPPEAFSQQVRLRRLDSLVCATVDFIKIDVEGAEKLVFDGAGPILSRDRPIILSEINNPCLLSISQVSSIDYLRYFEEIDYEVRTLLPDGRCGERVSESELTMAAGAINVACLPAEKVAEIMTRRTSS